MGILCSAAKSRTVSGSSVTPRTKLIGAPKSRAAFTRVLPHQPRPTIAVLSMRQVAAGAPGCFIGCARAKASFCMHRSTMRLTVGNGAMSTLK